MPDLLTAVPRPHRIRSKRRELSDTWTLALEPADEPLAAWGPGQFTMLYSFGVGEVPISISGDARRPRRLVQTVRAVGATTRALCSAKVGDIVGVRGPFGSSWDLAAATGRDVVFVAGGLGLAPLRPAIYGVLAGRDAYGDVSVLVGSRSPDLILYRAELERWRARGDLHVELTVDQADPDWREHVGVVPELLGFAPFRPDATSAFICGPEVMIRFTAADLLRRGVAATAMQVSLERNMHCALAHCGHCQLGPHFVCKDGPVFTYDRVATLMAIKEL